MAKGFTLSVYPWVYLAKYTGEDTWEEKYLEKPHKTPQEEDAMNPEERDTLISRRNSFPELPLVNYTTQYGMGCFEGLKAFPWKDGSLKLFRPDENGKRFASSMKGLRQPPYPGELFLTAARSVVKRNMKLGFAPVYQNEWEKDDFVSGESVYLRPFTYSEPAIGLGLSTHPWVVMVSTPVGAYFRPGNTKAMVTGKVRAFRGGTGWIKCDANYTVPILAKKEAEEAGFMEAVFLDAEEKTYIEEGSSCNIFFLLRNGTLVTPDLRDTVLPGITRKSIITLARDMGVKTEERQISIDEAMDSAVECFVTGTAAGVGPIESITFKGTEKVFSHRKTGELSKSLLVTLKGIQYGRIEDSHGWMFKAE